MGEVNVEQRGRVLIATLHNPPHGLMDMGTVDGLDTLVRRADADASVRAVVLTGSHPDRFVAHYDVGEILAGLKGSPAVRREVAAGILGVMRRAKRVPGVMRMLSGSPLAGLASIVRFHDVLLRMNRSDVVYLAAINGSTMGGGCELALACDRRIMPRGDHVIGQPEVLLGFPPGAGGTQRLVRLLGTGKALRVALDGLPLPAEEALAIGMVDALVPEGEVLERTVALAERLSGRPAVAIAGVKRAIYFGGSLPLEEGLAFEAAEFIAAAGAGDAVRLMAEYEDARARLGDIPGYDRERLARFAETGRFEAG